jgi:hypothetical protein
VLDAVALFGKRQAPWIDVERTNRQLRRAIVELVAPPPKTAVGVSRMANAGQPDAARRPKRLDEVRLREP